MRMKKCYLASLAIATFFTACNGNWESIDTHKLVVVGNEHSVPMYTDEQSYLKYSRMKQDGGVEGMAGQLANGVAAKSIDDGTPVKVLSKDDNGAQVEITAGPMKGETGFVPSQNLS